MRERDLQRSGMEWMRFSGWYVMRLNSGALSYERDGCAHMIRMLPAGTPDTVAFRPHPTCPGAVQMVFVEYKSPGKKATVMQEVKMEELRTYGATCVVVSSLEDLEQALARLGKGC